MYSIFSRIIINNNIPTNKMYLIVYVLLMYFVSLIYKGIHDNRVKCIDTRYFHYMYHDTSICDTAQP